MSIDFYIRGKTETKIENLGKNALMSTRGSNTVNGNIRKLVEPSPVYFVIIGISVKKKRKGGSKSAVFVNEHVKSALFKIGNNKLLWGINVSPLIRISVLSHKAAGASVYRINAVKIGVRCSTYMHKKHSF